MCHALFWICLIVLVAGCSKTPSTIGGSQSAYVDFEVDTQTNAIRRIGAEPNRLQNIPHVRFDRFNVLDTVGRKSDVVWIDNGVVYDWNQYKLLSNTPNGGLVLHQRFQPLFPDGNPWDEFLINDSLGETGVALDSLPEEMSREQLHFVYVYGSAGLMAASYDCNGQLIRIFARHDGGGTADYPEPGRLGPFVAYGLPKQFINPIIEPPLNDVLRTGLDRITASKYPGGPLTNVLVVEEFGLGRVYSIREFNISGQELTQSVLQFGNRPYDQAIVNAHRMAK